MSISFVDAFGRSNRTLQGNVVDGETWVTTVPGQELTDVGVIEDGGFTAPSTVYASILFDEAPMYMGGRFSFVPDDGESHGVIALIASADTEAIPTLQHMMHLQLSAVNGGISWWDSGDQANVLEGGAFTFSPALAEDGTQYDVWMKISGNNVDVGLPDGRVLHLTDTHTPDVAGRRVIWEIAYPTETLSSVPRWESVWAATSERSAIINFG